MGLLVAVVMVVPTCEAGEAGDGSTGLGQVVRQAGEPVSDAGPRRLTPSGTYRVSPAWSPSGRWLAVAGLRGVGLYLVPTAGGAEREVDADFRGPWRWRRDGDRDVLCFGDGPTADALDAETWELQQPCAPVDYDAERGRLIHSVDSRRFYSNSRLGTVSIVQDGRTRTIPLDQGAWGAKVSPDGRYVAYCSGTLAKAELLLLDVAAGRTRSLGPGAQASWYPDSKQLVYTVITHMERVGRAALVNRAYLNLHDVVTGKTRLIDTPFGRAATQPALSPDGGQLVYADWRSGAVYALPAPRQVTP